jgi:hypothetical protein
MAEYTNGEEFRFPGGDHMVQYEMSAGTAKLQVKDPQVSGGAYIDIPDSSKSASSAFIVTLGDGVSVKVVLTGDAKCSITKVR